MSPLRTTFQVASAISTRVQTDYERLMRHEYLILSNVTEEHLPDRIFPFAHGRDYFRIKMGSSRSMRIMKIALISNLLISVAFAVAEMLEVVLGAPTVVVGVSGAVFIVFDAMLWLFVDWKTPRNPHNIYL